MRWSRPYQAGCGLGEGGGCQGMHTGRLTAPERAHMPNRSCQGSSPAAREVAAVWVLSRAVLGMRVEQRPQQLAVRAAARHLSGTGRGMREQTLHARAAASPCVATWVPASLGSAAALAAIDGHAAGAGVQHHAGGFWRGAANLLVLRLRRPGTSHEQDAVVQNAAGTGRLK